MRHLDPSWLASQRWFRSKQRPIATIDEIDRADLAGGAALVVLAVDYGDEGASDRYLVPLVDGCQPEDGDGVWTAIARAMTEGATVPARYGRFAAASTGAKPPSVESFDSSAERRLRVEQSNTSVVLGERAILKLFRLLEPGVNPDAEVGAFLTGVGFADVATVFGSLEYVDTGGMRSAAAMLQAFVPSVGDGWTAMLAALARGSQPAALLAAEVGVLTRDLHAALASRPDVADFPARRASEQEAQEWAASAERQLDLACASVNGIARSRLEAVAPRIVDRLAGAFGTAPGAAPVSRIHGDYHLGQLLARPDGGLTVIDFEGEPARPLAERRRPASPMRDVAGMLRSFDYASRTAAADEVSTVHLRTEFLDAYAPTGVEEQSLLAAFELEKACYEVHYEANNRPDWLWLPLAALERLAAT